MKVSHDHSDERLDEGQPPTGRKAIPYRCRLNHLRDDLIICEMTYPQPDRATTTQGDVDGAARAPPQ